MRACLLALLVGLRASTFAQTSEEIWRDSLAAYWEQMEAHFQDPEESPLKKTDRKEFAHFKRFPLSEVFRINARFTPVDDAPEFEMKTSTERRPIYQIAGIVHFELSGTMVELPVYRNVMLSNDPEHGNYLFLPFTDLTNGEETYGGGRYLDLEGPIGETIELDFNKAYNPYCAYNDKYSCPIPPKENHIPVRVEAGVLSFKDH